MATKRHYYSWETSFDTANNTVTHTFSNRVQVVASTKTGRIQVYVDGKVKRSYGNMAIKQYEQLLLEVEQYASKLERRDNLKATLAKYAVWAIMCVGIFAFMLLGGDNDEWTMAEFMAQKAMCAGVIGGCYLLVQQTPALAAAWQTIDKNTKE